MGEDILYTFAFLFLLKKLYNFCSVKKFQTVEMSTHRKSNVPTSQSYAQKFTYHFRSLPMYKCISFCTLFYSMLLKTPIS